MTYRDDDIDDEIDDELDDAELPDPSDVDGNEDASDPCPHCGTPLYDDADLCPRCGNFISHTLSSPSRPTWMVILVLLLCVIFALFMWR